MTVPEPTATAGRDDAPDTAGPSSTAPARRGGLGPRDLITVGVFAALYVVVYFVFSFVGFINPVVLVVSLLLGVIAGGIPFMLFLTRVHRPGMIFLFSALLGILLLVLGEPPLTVGWLLLLGVVCELIMRAGRYRSRTAAVATYTVFACWVAGQFFPLFYDRAGYLSNSSMSQMSPEYLATFNELLSVRNLILFDLAIIPFGLAGALLGLRLLDKHFRRAGLS
ncbi:MAG: MptD family putative ECF transporter S component [Gordonia sp. (in: high G+C Gram-positive bacteria)]